MTELSGQLMIVIVTASAACDSGPLNLLFGARVIMRDVVVNVRVVGKNSIVRTEKFQRGSDSNTTHSHHGNELNTSTIHNSERREHHFNATPRLNHD